MLLRRVLFSVLLFVVSGFASGGKLSGKGTVENPWQIADYEDLKAVGSGAYLFSGHYVLTADIDALSSTQENCADDGCKGFTPWAVNEDFTGSLDGQNHSINHLYIWEPSKGYVGFVSNLKGSVSNLKFDDLKVMGNLQYSDHVGGVAGCISGSGRISNVHVTKGFIHGFRYVGGVVGRASSTNEAPVEFSLENVSYQGKVVGKRDVGGVVGFLRGNAKNAVSNVNLYVKMDNAGGIAGRMVASHGGSCSVIQSRSRVVFHALDWNINNVGGITGHAEKCTLRQDNADVDFAVVDPLNHYPMNSNVGGLIGISDSSEVYFSFAQGNVNGRETVDGLVGSNSGDLAYSYFMGSVNGKSVINQPEEILGQSFNMPPVAAPTAAEKRPESPVVNVVAGGDRDLIGQWLNWAVYNKDRDSIYFAYRAGYVQQTDTIWGPSSYMAVPNKIEISSIEDLKKIGHDDAYPLSASYELTADIDGLDSVFAPIGDSLDPFMGTFNGNGHTISNLKIDEPKQSFVGLFGVVNYGTIENLKLYKANVNGASAVGALAGIAKDSKIHDVMSIDGFVSGVDSVGGLAGVLGWSGEDDGLVYQIASTGMVSGRNSVGGIAGNITFVDLQNAFAISTVKGEKNVGGLFGVNNGNSQWINVQTSYFAGIVEADNERGIIGYEDESRDSLCYFNRDLVKDENVSGLSTNEMVLKSSFEGFDFGFVWDIQEGVSYPYLKGMDPVLPGTMGEKVDLDMSSVASSESVADEVVEDGKMTALRNGDVAILMFDIPRDGDVSFSIVDVDGHDVLQKDVGRLSAGSHVSPIDLNGLTQERLIAVLSLDGESMKKTLLK